MSNPTSETAFLKLHLKQGHMTSSKVQELSIMGDCTSLEDTPIEKLPQQEVARMDLPLSCCRKSKCKSSGPNFYETRLKCYSGSHSEFHLNQKIEKTPHFLGVS